MNSSDVRNVCSLAMGAGSVMIAGKALGKVSGLRVGLLAGGTALLGLKFCECGAVDCRGWQGKLCNLVVVVSIPLTELAALLDSIVSAI